MSSGLIVALEAGFVLGGVILFAAWELYKLRQERRRNESAMPDENKKAE